MQVNIKNLIGDGYSPEKSVKANDDAVSIIWTVSTASVVSDQSFQFIRRPFSRRAE